jgi:hypothetical protein
VPSLYEIKDWDQHFEQSQSRRVLRLSWVGIPNRHDGKSFRRLMLREDGPAIYGAWILLVQVASKCPRRGILEDGDGPLDEDDLAIKTGAPSSLFETALKVLSDKKIGWIICTELGADSESSRRPCTTQTNRQTERTDKQTLQTDRSNDRGSTDRLIGLKDVSGRAKALADEAAKVGGLKGARSDPTLLKAATAVARGDLPENVLMVAAESTGREPRRKPMAYFTQCLKRGCEEIQFDFAKILSTKHATGPPAGACEVSRSLAESLSLPDP